MGAVQCLAKNAAFVAGTHLNIYSGPILELIAGMGAMRWIAPLEMSRDGLMEILRTRPDGIETEVFAYGRMPLAFSARCFTARNRNLPKDACEFSCLAYPDGLLLRTREKQNFLVLNGIQTQSAKVYNLATELKTMRAMGVNLVRISPQSQDTGRVIEMFRDILDERIDGALAMQHMEAWMPDQACNGYWHGKPGLDQTVPH